MCNIQELGKINDFRVKKWVLIIEKDVKLAFPPPGTYKISSQHPSTECSK